MTKQTSWMKNVALLTSVCASGFAAGCGSEPMTDDHEIDSPTGEVQQLLVPGTWVSPPGNGVMLGFTGGLGPLTVCRAPFDGGQQPGKVWEGQCNFGWGGQEVRSSNYEVLLDTGLQWITGVSQPPQNAIDGGDAGITAHSVRLAVCQVFKSEDSTWHPGKFYAGKCNIAWGRHEVVVSPGPNVYILVKP